MITIIRLSHFGIAITETITLFAPNNGLSDHIHPPIINKKVFSSFK